MSENATDSKLYPLPSIPEDLVKALDLAFPERCPEPEWSDRDIWMRVGERRVIRFLLRKFKEQTDNVMRDTNVLGGPT